ncbi:hypothetical protein [Nitrosopumilus sp.]|uniref:SDH family Clp fold serine proteinase n=1 Tax=Nitrosopumilus sp. TaxID=2024843 RepID=UPI0034A026C5
MGFPVLSYSCNTPSIDYTDILPVQDQLSNLSGEAIDVILETPGGVGEVVEDIVKLLRDKYEHVGIIIPGWAKSAGTIFAMAGDEILMGSASGLGPIDAQIITNSKRFSADAFLEGLEKIKNDIIQSGKLNPAYIPMLQQISPGEIQHCENAQKFSKRIVTEWLENYKFKFWKNHSTGNPVTQEERHKRAEEIATELCSQSRWLTHGRSIKIKDLEELRVKITNYSNNKDLNDAIIRYHTLLRMSFEDTAMYKLFETPDTQISRFQASVNVKPENVSVKDMKIVNINFVCPQCKTKYTIQVNLNEQAPINEGCVPYPIENNMFKCIKCNKETDVSRARLQIEAQTGKSVV